MASVGYVVRTVVDRLRVRVAPGTENESVGFLAIGTVGYVYGDPVVVDGVPWLPMSGPGIPNDSGCATRPPDEPIACPVWRGWVASENENEVQYLERTDYPNCPEREPDLEDLVNAGYAVPLMCFGGQDIVFTGYWPEIPDDAGLGGVCSAPDGAPGWLLCQNINYNVVVVSEDQPFLMGVRLSIDPEGSLKMPKRGQWVRVTAHADDPAAAGCAKADPFPGTDSLGMVFICRTQLVPTAVEPTDAP